MKPKLVPMYSVLNQCYRRTRKKNPNRAILPGPNPFGREGRLKCKKCRDWRQPVSVLIFGILGLISYSANLTRIIWTILAIYVEFEDFDVPPLIKSGGPPKSVACLQTYRVMVPPNNRLFSLPRPPMIS